MRKAFLTTGVLMAAVCALGCVSQNEQLLGCVSQNEQLLGCVSQNEQLADAVYHKDMEKAKQLLAAGAQVNAAPKYRPHPSGSLGDAFDSNRGYRPLHYAVANGDIEMTQFLLASGADVHALSAPASSSLTGVEANARPPILLAAQRDDLGMAKILLAAGAKANAADGSGCQALHYAGNPELIALFLASGAKLNAVNSLGQQPIHCASTLDCMQTLRSANGQELYLGIPQAGVEAQSKRVHALLAAGADVRVENADGMQPLHILARDGHTSLILASFAGSKQPLYPKEAQKTPAKLVYFTFNITDKVDMAKQRQVLADASRGEIELAKVLLAAGAKASAKTKAGETAVELAQKNGHPELAAFLAEQAAKEKP